MSYQTLGNIFAGWRDDVLTGSPPVFYPIGSGELARIEIGPGLVTLIGGAPGAGKSAFAMQVVTDALRLTPRLRASVCSIEMPPNILLERQLARFSGIGLTTIRYRQFDQTHADRLDRAMHTLEALGERLAFVRPPFDLENVAESADAFDADMIVLDYIQRIPPPGQHGDRRGAIDATMNHLRQFADAGIAVLVAAAVARSRDRHGRSSYEGDGLSLASFRESSELEFGADDAFILVPDHQNEQVELRHLKARHTAPRNIMLWFDRVHQSFTSAAARPLPSLPQGQGGFHGW
ncbi:MAG TPA: DnaB-like helicase C-terminal domain-containing protein [Pirellulales bacterium]|nr:DnaB-like helicase C-terminal domain-containing protein [Pirellulales bacterium]